MYFWMLRNLYLNDQPTVTEFFNINMFADDTEIDWAVKPGCSTQLESNITSDLCKLK